jgi:integrase
VKPIAVAPSPKVLVNAKVFRTVAANLTDPKTRARFMVIASTGVRPSELKRAEPGDVDTERRVWLVRTGKGGAPRAFWLNDEMLSAIEAFIAAGAWGAFDGSDYAKALYVAGWPKDVRPYQARHSMALELGERGIDLADVSAVLGHRDIVTTRKHYAPILSSRLKDASERLAGRFSGWLAPEREEKLENLPPGIANEQQPLVH